jgi:hypothetical protein
MFFINEADNVFSEETEFATDFSEFASDETVLAISGHLLNENKEAYKILAK